MSKSVLLLAFAAASNSLDTLARLALTQRRRAPKKLPAVGAGECAPAPDALWLVGSFHKTGTVLNQAILSDLARRSAGARMQLLGGPTRTGVAAAARAGYRVLLPPRRRLVRGDLRPAAARHGLRRNLGNVGGNLKARAVDFSWRTMAAQETSSIMAARVDEAPLLRYVGDVRGHAHYALASGEELLVSRQPEAAERGPESTHSPWPRSRTYGT